MSLQKRTFADFQNAAIDEELSQEPWYALKPEEIETMVQTACDKLAAPLGKYANIDSRFQSVIDAVKRKRKLPEIRQFSIAVLGEQGIGKSSVINALLDRGLLDRSGSSKACTAYATILEYKQGAPDQATSSDLSVEFLDKEEARYIIKEQMDRWTEARPGPKTREPSQSDDEDEAEYQDKGDNESKDQLGTVQPPVHKSSNKSSHAAATAKEFFEVIFDVESCSDIRDWLDNELHHTNIQTGSFFDICCKKVDARFKLMAAEKKELDLETRKARFTNVSDRKLWKDTTVIKELWPLVKAVTIETGHVLLRHGLRLLDLPGYGDTSQLREAVINSFRRQADFEIVVAPFSRFQTSVLQEQYINRSIHLKGANKTILVMNKSDVLMNEDNMGTQIRQVKEEPFPLLKERLEHISALEDEDGADSETIHALLDELLRDATIAYVKHETANVQKHMHSKGIKVFSVSALCHIKSKNRRRNGAYVLDEKTAGIIELRNFMARLPAATNYQNYRDHVYGALEELRNEVTRPLEEHMDDETYAAMRRQLEKQIASLRIELQHISKALVHDLVEKPWCDHDEQNIADKIKRLTNKTWVHPHIYSSGFAKMLRENGIPVNGKYYGRNMNADLLGTMKTYYDEWYNSMEVKVRKLARVIFQPVTAIIFRTQSAIDASSAHQALKHRVTKELDIVHQRIKKIHDTFLTSLYKSLAETYSYFTTEIDIYCPIAKEMRPCYDRALDPKLVHSGSGTYSRQRKVLCASIIRPSGTGLRPLVEKIGGYVQMQQRGCWNMASDAFISDAIDQLNGFLNTTKQVLRNSSYTATEHSKARRELGKLLADFDIHLRNIRSRFQRLEEERTEKRVKRE